MVFTKRVLCICTQVCNFRYPVDIFIHISSYLRLNLFNFSIYWSTTLALFEIFITLPRCSNYYREATEIYYILKYKNAQCRLKIDRGVFMEYKMRGLGTGKSKFYRQHVPRFCVAILRFLPGSSFEYFPACLEHQD